MWEDVKACVVWLVVAGPPAEEVACLQDEEADEVHEVLLPVEEVCLSADVRW